MNASKIKKIRNDLELTQTDMAKQLGVTRSAYSLWEINKNIIPLYYLNKLSNMYNINIDYLVDLSEEKNIKFNKIDINQAELGKKLKFARKEINYSQEKLASILNTTHSVISAYESGKTKIPTIFLIEISKITNKSLNWFIGKISE